MSIPNASDVSDIKPLLEDGEQVLWAERPDRWAYARSGGGTWITLLGIALLTGAAWCFAAYFGQTGQKVGDQSSSGPFGIDGKLISGGFLALVGLMTAISLPHRWLESGKVIQFITDRRVAVVNASKRPPKFIGQWGVEPLKFLEVRHRGGGVGSLLVGRDPSAKGDENAL